MLDPSIRNTIGEVAGARANLQEAQAVLGVREETYEDRLQSGRKHVAEVYGGEDGFVGSDDAPEFIRASLEVEGLGNYEGAKVERRVREFQQADSPQGLMVATNPNTVFGRDTLVAFNNPTKPRTTNLTFRRIPQTYPGHYELTVIGGDNDLPIISAKHGRYSSDSDGIGRYEAGEDGVMENVSFSHLEVVGGFLGHKDKEAFEEVVSAIREGELPTREDDHRILFDEQAIEYLEALFVQSIPRSGEAIGHAARRGAKGVSDEQLLVLATKDILGVDHSDLEQQLIESEGFKGRILGAVRGYAAALAKPDQEQKSPDSSRVPLYLHRTILGLVAIEDRELDLAAEEGIAKAGRVLDDEAYAELAHRVKAGKKRDIRGLVEPALTARIRKVGEHLADQGDMIGRVIDPSKLVVSAFSDRNLFMRLTLPDFDTIVHSEQVYGPLRAYIARAKSFRT